MAALILIAGLVFLAVSGDALVRGAVGAARRLRVPPLVIGLTVVAFGTSAPELVVSVDAALEGAPGLSIGNVIGSNISNLLLVLGLPAIFAPIFLTEAGIRRSSVFMIGVTILVMALAADGVITRFEGVGMLALLAVYLVYNGVSISRTRTTEQAKPGQAEPEKPLGGLATALFIVLGIAGLAIGGKLTTEGALGIADSFGLAESAVGLTIVALGTSLPELAATLAAAIRRQTGMAFGNVIGSNVFNLLGILGTTAAIIPLEVAPSLLTFDIWVLLATSLAILPIALSGQRITRWEGAIMSTAYAAYAIVAIRNGMAV